MAGAREGSLCQLPQLGLLVVAGLTSLNPTFPCPVSTMYPPVCVARMLCMSRYPCLPAPGAHRVCSYAPANSDSLLFRSQDRPEQLMGLSHQTPLNILISTILALIAQLCAVACFFALLCDVGLLRRLLSVAIASMFDNHLVTT